LPFEKISEMLASPIHEHRLGALIALVEKYKKTKSEAGRREIADYYVSVCHLANNWDLVDLSAPYILGCELSTGNYHDTVRRFVASECLWERRVAVVATLMRVRHGQLDLALEMCLKSLDDPEPLMRKATGWILREVGKKDVEALQSFLRDNIDRLSSITLSYATEKLSPSERSELRNMRNLRKKS
ncbi:MAG: DNA alkylation repair protein, partial [Muribaculaceae bacterium]